MDEARVTANKMGTLPASHIAWPCVARLFPFIKPGPFTLTVGKTRPSWSQAVWMGMQLFL